MKKVLTLLSIVLALNTTVAFAQATPAAKPKPAAKSSAKPKLSKADSLMLDKDWHVVAVVEWNKETRPPADINKNDKLKLSSDGTYTLTMFDKPYSGTWSKSGQSLTLKGADGFFKMVLQEPGKLKIDHFSDNDGHSIFEYEAK